MREPDRARLAVAAMIGMGVILAACTGGPSTTPTPTSASSAEVTLPPDIPPPPTGLTPPSDVPVATASPEVPPIGEPSGEPTSLPSAGSNGPALDRHADPSLEGVLPSQVDGVPLVKYSLTSAEFVSADSRPRFESFVAGLGGDPAAVTFAAAVDPTGMAGGSVTALRVPGADPTALLQGILAAEAEQEQPPVITQGTLGIRPVTVATYELGAQSVTRYFYAKGDIVFTITAVESTLAEFFMAQLP